MATTHAYEDYGNYLVTIRSTDPGSGFERVERFTAWVEDRPISMATVSDWDIVVGQSVDGILATFDDDDDTTLIGDYRATVEWGDGFVTTYAEVTGTADDGAIEADHVYAAPGHYRARVQIRHGGSTAESYFDVRVSPTIAPTTTLELDPEPFEVASWTYDGPVALFNDWYSPEGMGYAATIDWGDGTGPTPGTISWDSQSFGLVVTGSHHYRRAGLYPVVVHLQDSSRSVRSRTTAVVLGETKLEASAKSWASSEYSDVVVASVSAPSLSADVSATIHWGDGSQSEGQVISGYVVGSHIYSAAPGSEPDQLTQVVVLRQRGQADIVLMNDVSVTPWTAGSDGPDDSSLFFFRDERHSSIPNWADDFDATLTWEYQTDQGMIAGPGRYFVVQPPTGGIVFDEPDDNATIDVHVDGDGGSTVDGTYEVAVADSVLTPGSVPFLEAMVNVSTDEVIVGSFQSTNLNDLPDDFVATIDWGDGLTSEGTITGELGEFDITGEHVYRASGWLPVVVRIHRLEQYVDSPDYLISGWAEVEGQTLPTEAFVRVNDPSRAESQTIGESTVMPNTGGLRLVQPLDFDLSPGTTVGGSPALIYNSETVHSIPIVEVRIQTDPYRQPTLVYASLRWADQSMTRMTFLVTAPSPTGIYTVQLPAPAAIGATDCYRYEVELSVRYDVEGSDEPKLEFGTTIVGAAPVVAQDISPFGAGWGLGNSSRLVFVEGGVMRVLGNGDFRTFSRVSDDVFSSPVGELGRLARIFEVDSDRFLYVYNDRHGETSYYADDGQLISVVDPRFRGREFAYFGGMIAQVTFPDGGKTTFLTDDGRIGAIVQPGGRVTELAIDPLSGSPLWYDPARNFRFFDTDAKGRIVFTGIGAETLEGPRYDRLSEYELDFQGRLVSIDRTGKNIWSITPASSSTIRTETAAGTWALSRVIDGNGRKTVSLLDSAGRIFERRQADGSSLKWDWDSKSHGQMIWSLDGNNNGQKSYEYNATGDLTRVAVLWQLPLRRPGEPRRAAAAVVHAELCVRRIDGVGGAESVHAAGPVRHVERRVRK
jgi:hypothetical protein